VTKYCYAGRIFDGSEFWDQGAVIFDDQTGLIEAAGVENEVAVPPGAINLSLTNGTLLPGLVDAHLHFFGTRRFDTMDFITTPRTTAALRCVNDLTKLLNAGFTAVRDLGSKTATYLRKAVEEGTLLGPTIFASGRSLAQTGGNDDLTRLPLNVSKQLSYSLYCDGGDGCRKAVRTVIRDGANVIKVYASGSLDQAMEEGTTILRQFSVEELKVIVEEAHANHLKVAAHAYWEEAMTNALEAGVDSIEHGIGLTEELAARMAKQGTFYVPTASLYSQFFSKLSSDLVAKLQRHQKDEIQLALNSGVKVVMGTDYAGTETFPHGQNYEEIKFMARAIGNKSALQAATINGAACLGRKDSFGEIRAGMKADLIIVNGDPGKDLESLAPRNVYTVVQNGKLRKERTHRPT
jgi:imidazolonepropionase-like amidohydrolase